MVIAGWRISPRTGEASAKKTATGPAGDLSVVADNGATFRYTPPPPRRVRVGQRPFMSKKVQVKVAPAPIRTQPATTDSAAQTTTEDGGWLGDLVAAGLGLLAWGVAAIVEPGIRDLFQWPKQKLLATGAALLVGLMGALWFGGVRWRWSRSPLVWPLLFLLASMGLSLLVAPSQTGGTLSIFARYDAHRWLAAGALFGVTATALSTPRRLWYLLGGLTLGGLTVARIGIGEHHDIAALLPPPNHPPAASRRCRAIRR